MNELEYLIFLPIKRLVSGIARLAFYTLLVLGITSACELILLLTSGSLFFLFSYLSHMLMLSELLLLSLLAPWCHNVLLAKRGMSVTRCISVFCTVMGLIMLVCEGYTLVTGHVLLVKQAQTPFFICTALLLCIMFNLGNMAVAPLKWRISIPCFLLALLCAVISSEAVVDVCILFKFATVFLGAGHLRRLALIAPAIISMPQKD